jgi:hypothetical protein
MVRKQIYIEERQEKLLKQRAHELGVSEAALVRSALDVGLSLAAMHVSPAYRSPLLPDTGAREELLAAMRARMAEGPLPGGRTWTREEIYAERVERVSHRH